MNMLEGVSCLFFQPHQFRGHFVHCLRTLAAKGREDHRAIVQAQLFTAGLLLIIDKFAADRHAHNLNFFRILIVLDALREAYQISLGPAGGNTGGKSRNRIGFVNTAGNFHHARCQQHGKAGITAGTYHHIRLKLTNDLFALFHSVCQQFQSPAVFLDAAEAEIPVHTVAGQCDQLVTCLGNQLLLHAANSAYKQDLAVGMAEFPRICHSNRGIDMASGTAAGKNNIHNTSSILDARFRIREIPSKIPISPKFTANAVPP